MKPAQGAPDAIDCVGSWAESEKCNVKCGSGLAMKKFVITTKAENGGKQCSFEHGQKKPEPCEGPEGECQPKCEHAPAIAGSCDISCGAPGEGKQTWTQEVASGPETICKPKIE